MRKLLLFGVGLIWFVFVYSVTWWVTFPSDALAGRAAALVKENTGGTMALSVSSISPWWTGVKATDVALSQVDEDEGTSTTMFAADAVRVKVGLLGLLTDSLVFSGNTQVGDGRVDYAGDVSGVFAGESVWNSLTVEAEDFPVPSLMSVLGSTAQEAVRGVGNVDFEMKVKMPDGTGEADGKVVLSGKDLSLQLNIPDPIAGGDERFELGPVQISDLDLKLDIDEGIAKVSRGRLLSDYITVEMSGDAKLEDDFDRSRLRFKLALSELGTEIQPYAGFMSRAKWDDEKYHYALSCRVSRLNGRCFRPERQRKSRGIQRDTAENVDSPLARPERDPAMDEERERRRRERAERRKSRASRPGDDADRGRDGEDEFDGGDDTDGLDDDRREDDDRGSLDREELPPLEAMQEGQEDVEPGGNEDLGFEE